MAIGQGIYTTTAGVKEWYKQKYKGQNMLDMAVNAAEQQASAATAQTYLAAEAQKGAYKSQYEQALDKAYQANLEQRSNILNSNLIAGTKKEMLSDTDIALQDAYSSYLSTLQGSIADVEAQEAKQYASIDKELSTVKEQADKLLTTEAENITKGIDYAFDYLQEVGKYAEQTEGGLEALYNDPNWSRYIEKYTEEGREEPMYRMYSREQLSRPRIDVETGEQLGLYDSMGNLTKAGQDFFDQMINFDWTDYGALKDMQSYGSFVAGKDKDFYNWLAGENAYGVTPDAFGRNLNIGVVREAMGLKSDDETYRQQERRVLSTPERNKLGAETINALLGFNFTPDDYSEFTKQYDISDTKYASEIANALDAEKLDNLRTLYKQRGQDTSTIDKLQEMLSSREDYESAKKEVDFIEKSLKRNYPSYAKMLKGDFSGVSGVVANNAKADIAKLKALQAKVDKLKSNDEFVKEVAKLLKTLK